MTTTAASIVANNENDLDNARRALADARAASPSSRALVSPTRFNVASPRIDRAASPSRMSSVFGMATRLFNPPAAAQEVYAKQPSQEYQFGVQEGQDFRYSLSDQQIDQNATQQAGHVYDQQEYSTQYSYGEQQQQQYYDYSLQQATGHEYYPSDLTQHYHPDSYDYYNNDATYLHQQPHSYGKHQYGDQTGNYIGIRKVMPDFKSRTFMMDKRYIQRMDQVPPDSKKVSFMKPGFWRKFIELHGTMWSVNQGLTGKHPYESRPIS
ncbi:hypothetical protein HDU81_008590 [Chytriomyces hyalinus]|nr:hypothetical protein HDU81_008590 [Chytriomyces hyalinus]